MGALGCSSLQSESACEANLGGFWPCERDHPGIRWMPPFRSPPSTEVEKVGSQFLSLRHFSSVPFSRCLPTLALQLTSATSLGVAWTVAELVRLSLVAAEHPSPVAGISMKVNYTVEPCHANLRRANQTRVRRRVGLIPPGIRGGFNRAHESMESATSAPPRIASLAMSPCASPDGIILLGRARLFRPSEF